jgi:glycine/D-amino acid oxidase-like deaminating enzyme
MDLRSGHPYWLVKNGLIASYPTLGESTSCEVAIIGGGITGALIAVELNREGLDVVLLDKRDVATGSTAASTALLQYEIDTELIPLIEKVGEANAVRAYRLGLDAIDRVEQLAGELPDDCGFIRRDSLYLASRASHAARLRAECECRRRMGFACEMLGPEAIAEQFPFSGPAAILSRGDAEIDAFRFTHRLLERAAQGGVRIFDRTTVTGIDREPSQVTLHTERGATVTAARVVFATGYESKQYLRQKVGTLQSTYALVSEPMSPFPRWPGRCLIWESARPYFYLRTTPDDRVIMGGEDTSFASDHRRDRLIERKTKRLVRRFSKMFPETPLEVAYAWAGTFGESKDGLAYIGRPADWPNGYFTVGYGGNGITMSVIAARLIADDIIGRPNADAQIYRFGR